MSFVTQQYVQSPVIEVGGRQLDASWADNLTLLSLEMQFQVPSRLTLRFTMPGLGSDADAQPFPIALDDEITVGFPKMTEASGTAFASVTGALHVTEIGAELDAEMGLGELVVVAHDASFRLTRAQRVATYASMTVSDVATRLARDAGLRVGTVDATSEPLPYLMQTDTDFGFITALARRVGYDWWVDGGVFNFARPSSSPPEVDVEMSSTVTRLSVSRSSIPTSEVNVLGWDRDHQQLIRGSATPGSLPSTQLPGVSSAGTAPSGSTPLSTAAVAPETVAEANQIAFAMVAAQVASAVEADGELIGNPDVKPGVTVNVVGKYVGGAYRVTRCEHRFTMDGYRTRFMAGDRRPSGIVDLLGRGDNAEHNGALVGLPALIPAVVSAIGTGEHLGRVQVTFPYLSEDNSSHWARVLSAGGGPERGFWFLPEVDDEVLVAFEGGDSRFPVVMGGLYGVVNTPESELIKDGKINSRSVRSRLGHYLDFVDGTSDTDRHILMGLGKDGRPGLDYKLRLGEDRFDIEVPSGKPISIKAGNSQITFTDSDLIEIKADKILLNAADSLTLEGGKVKISADNELTISQGGNKVSMGSGGLDVKGSPSASVKGSPNVSIG